MAFEREQIHINQIEKTPENKIQVLFMFLKAINDASHSGNINEEINQTLNFCVSALAELPNDKYNVGDLFKLEPDYREFRKEYVRSLCLLFPELAYSYESRINHAWKQKHLRLLQYERLKIEKLLKSVTGWTLETNRSMTLGK